MPGFLKISLPMTILLIILVGCGGGGGGADTQGLAGSSPGTSGTATLAWNPVTTNSDGTPCTDLAGYRLYYSVTSPVTRSNSTMLDVGNTTTVEVGALTSGKTYYFRVSAYNDSGLESALSSDEATKIIL